MNHSPRPGHAAVSPAPHRRVRPHRATVIASCYAVAWTGFGLANLVATGDRINSDARLLVSIVTVACTIAAGASAVLLRRGWPRAAGACLLLSSAMPTFLWYPLNLVTIVVGVALIVTA